MMHTGKCNSRLEYIRPPQPLSSLLRLRGLVKSHVMSSRSAEESIRRGGTPASSDSPAFVIAHPACLSSNDSLHHGSPQHDRAFAPGDAWTRRCRAATSIYAALPINMDKYALSSYAPRCWRTTSSWRSIPFHTCCKQPKERIGSIDVLTQPDVPHVFCADIGTGQ